MVIILSHNRNIVIEHRFSFVICYINSHQLYRNFLILDKCKHRDILEPGIDCLTQVSAAVHEGRIV